jgi:hypothetical protein
MAAMMRGELLDEFHAALTAAAEDAALEALESSPAGGGGM